MIYNIDKLTEAEKGYFAGFFDGEGCVLIGKSIRKDKSTARYSLSVSFNISYAPILYKMKKMFFGGNIRKQDLDKIKNEPSVIKSKNAGCLNPNNWKQRYHYTLNGREAWVFLKVIYQYCNEKKEQVRIAIEYFDGKRNRHSSGLSKWDIERNEYYYKTLQNLKRNETLEEKSEDLFDKQTNLTIFSEV